MRHRTLTSGRGPPPPPSDVIGRLLSAITDIPKHLAATPTDRRGVVSSRDGVVGAVIEEDGVDARDPCPRPRVMLALAVSRNSPRCASRSGVPGDTRDTMGAPGNTGLAFQGEWPPRPRQIALMDQARGVDRGSASPMALGLLAVVTVGSSSIRTGSGLSTSPDPYDRIGRPSSSRSFVMQ